MNLSNKDSELSDITCNALTEHFGAPGNSAVILDKMLSQEEQLFISAAEPGRDYAPWEIEKLFGECRQTSDSETEDPKTKYPQLSALSGFSAAAGLYHRGVIDPGEKVDTYRIGNFWNRLDIFATEEPELYGAIPEKIRLEVEAAYLKRYEESLRQADTSGEGRSTDFRPTGDEVLPVEDVLGFIDSKDEQAYLADCDCRSLRQACEAPRDLCITYRTGPFSFVRRGLAKPITKEQAKEIVLRAEKEGLVHTVNPGGVCSCCTDCCYLFRAAEDIGCLGTWPKVSYRIELDESACISCGQCLKMCRFDVLKTTTGNKVFIADIDRCQGCGLCRRTCPANALKLIRI